MNTVLNIRRNTKRYIDILCTVVDEICSTLTPNNPELTYKDSVLDVIINQRRTRDQNIQNNNESTELFPAALTRR